MFFSFSFSAVSLDGLVTVFFSDVSLSITFNACVQCVTGRTVKCFHSETVCCCLRRVWPLEPAINFLFTCAELQPIGTVQLLFSKLTVVQFNGCPYLIEEDNNSRLQWSQDQYRKKTLLIRNFLLSLATAFSAASIDNTQLNQLVCKSLVTINPSLLP